MKRPRTSIAALMMTTAVLGTVVAALREPSPIWAALIYTLDQGLNLVAILIVVLGRGRLRAMAVGFLVCGGGYLVLAVLEWNSLPPYSPHFITSLFFQRAAQALAADLTTDDNAMIVQTADCLVSLATGSLGSLLAGYVSGDRTDLSEPTKPTTGQP